MSKAKKLHTITEPKTDKLRYCKRSELNAIEYDKERFSKQGDLHLLLSFEGIGIVVVIHCASLTVTEPEPSAKEAA